MDEDENPTVVEEPADDTVVVAEEEAEVEVDNSEVNVEVEPVVIVESPTDAGPSDGEMDRAIVTAERLTALESQMGEMLGQVSELSFRMQDMQAAQELTAEVVVEQAEEQDALEDAVAETVAEDLDIDEDDNPDTPPSTAKRHWFFRSWKEWRK